ncbi:MAG: hypothetical protein GXO79_14155 [Chlorobi bacterium]|nr:hypothetical protein [Chlorobiota bacterium]
MLKSRTLFFTISFFLILPVLSFSQRCGSYHITHGNFSENKFYQIHKEASRSALFVKGETSHMYLEVFNGRDYRISITHDDILGGPIRFKLIDQEDDALLYDNANDNYTQEFEFTVTKSRMLIIEISVPGSSVGLEKTSQEKGLFKKDTEIGCVGVLIEHMITPRKGF